MNVIRLVGSGPRVRPLTMASVLVILVGVPSGTSAVDFDLGFRNPADRTELSWLAQPGATGYQLLRSPLTEFSTGCAAFETAELQHSDPVEPEQGGGLFYLVRRLTPEPGAWGASSDGDVRPIPCVAPIGSLVASTGCKPLGGGSTTAGGMLTPDCIEWTYLGGGSLLLSHINTAFNCCPEYEAWVDVEGDAMSVIEHETGGDCDCVCLFDLSYEVADVSPDVVYQVTVYQAYLFPEDERLEFPMDLQASPTGSHCVARDHYPW